LCAPGKRILLTGPGEILRTPTMTEDEKRICDLEKEVVALQEKIAGTDKALVLAAGITAAASKANISLALALVTFALYVLNMFHGH
jgi:hypothetical protein